MADSGSISQPGGHSDGGFPPHEAATRLRVVGNLPGPLFCLCALYESKYRRTPHSSSLPICAAALCWALGADEGTACSTGVNRPRPCRSRLRCAALRSGLSLLLQPLCEPDEQL